MKDIKYCKTTEKMSDEGQFPIVQVTFLDVIDDAAVANQYGVHCSPKTGSPCLLLQINSDPANKIIIPLSAFARPTDEPLEENEAVFGNFEIGSIVKFYANGDIKVVCKNNLSAEVTGTLTAEVTGNTTITTPQLTLNGDLVVDGTIDATGEISSDADCVSDGVSGKGHTHPVSVPSTPYSGNTSAPN